MIHTTELLESILLDQKEGSEPKKGTKKTSGHYKMPDNFKAFEETIPMKLMEVLGMTPGHVFNPIKDWELLDPPRWIKENSNPIKDRELLGPPRWIKENSKQNPSKLCHYHEAKGPTLASVETSYDNYVDSTRMAC